MNAAIHRKNLCKLLQQASRRRHLWDVFGDFVEMAALSMANGLPLARSQAREDRYLQVIKRYEADEQALFPRMLAEVVMGLEAEPHDLLGMVFGELELGNAARGQFFTPYHVCEVMAQLTVDEQLVERVQRRGFVTAQEPAVGAGAMVIAMAMAMKARGLVYQETLHVTAVDVDPRAVHMAYLQFSLLGIPAVVVLGNTLTLEEREHWHTPVHHLGLWERKLARGYALGSPADLDQPPAAPWPETAPPPAPGPLEAIQLGLFAMEPAA